ncbi:IQ domain-containing protein IQM2-like [Rutidosis leptorrhynchoides]|uniref:IQ domain-containing protein IQM2-like n=1 Tax=Rutidosis leptorrhynchoides TaxID=125765 RepID=UPI003A9A60F6
MGLSYSCPFTVYTDLETVGTSLVEETELDYAKMKEMCSEFDNVMNELTESSVLDLGSPEHEAAIKLQKVYKSFRTRRKLADCAVQIEQSLWKLQDFVELKRSSISFFNLNKQETAFSRWSRARTRAAKVGKGLSKNNKAQKLALQHWLEAIDPRHRYGHNLHFYYGKWLASHSKEPFFYWLDIGEGKEINLVDKCPRSKLQQQCIKYLGPIERKAYEVVMEDGKLLYKETGEFVDTTREPKGSKWIFVLSTSKILYVGLKIKGSFQHSSFLAGGATLAAGRIVADHNGTLKAIWPHSGHYRPTEENFQDFISFLKENDVDMTYVKMDSDEDKEPIIGNHIRSHSSEEEEVMSEKEPPKSIDDRLSKNNNVTKQQHTSGFQFKDFVSNLSTLERDDDTFVSINTNKNQGSESCSNDYSNFETILDGYEAADDSFDSQQNCTTSIHQLLSDDDEEEDEAISIHKQKIKETNDNNNNKFQFQLGRQSCCIWSTGAGPRISCLRDYPAELQSHALEQANLSPRSAPTTLNMLLCTTPLSSLEINRSKLMTVHNRPSL